MEGAWEDAVFITLERGIKWSKWSGEAEGRITAHGDPGVLHNSFTETEAEMVGMNVGLGASATEPSAFPARW